jgi:hypothetical protein
VGQPGSRSAVRVPRGARPRLQRRSGACRRR